MKEKNDRVIDQIFSEITSKNPEERGMQIK
jgi:hypothetical protein